MRHRPLPFLVIILSVLVSACGWTAAASDQPATGRSAAGIATADSELGTILVDAEGRTLYGFTDDTDGVSTCYDACAETWPPVPGDAAPDAALDAALFTTAARDDGGDQAVAGLWPLYTFSGDAAPGDLNGQGSGGVWFAVSPDGTLLDGNGAPASAAAAAPETAEPAVQAAQAGPAEAAPATSTGVDQAVLTDADGLSLYYFRNDGQGASNCNEPCSDTWPPVAAGEQIDTSGLELGRLGSITRDDGSQQLAYDGRALYRYVDDAATGDVNGQGIGNVWFAAAADGTEIGPQGVRIGSTDAGDVLIDADGFTLYTSANDAPGASSCNEPCSSTWPPVPSDTVIDTTAVRARQFDIVIRDDGSEQLALRGRPLYRYIDDANPGDANGQGIGNVWFAVPAGDVKGPGKGRNNGDGAAADGAPADSAPADSAPADAYGADGSDYR